MPKRKNREVELRRVTSPNQLLAVKRMAEIVGKVKGQKHISLGRLLRESGYSYQASRTPSRIVGTKSFQELLEKYLPDKDISKVHKGLLNASKIDHIVFPLSMSDKEMKKVVESISGCKVRKIKHGDTANHVWFWNPDNMSRLQAVREAYKVKNKYAPEEHIITAKLTDEQLNRIIGK